MITQVVMNQIDVQARTIRADLVITALPGVRLPLPLGEGWGEGLRQGSIWFVSVLQTQLCSHPEPLPEGVGNLNYFGDISRRK